MQIELLQYLKCPVTKEKLDLQTIKKAYKSFGDLQKEVIEEGILISPSGFLYPIIKGIPRLLVESIDDYKDFLSKHYADFAKSLERINNNYRDVIEYATKKNKKTKKSFTKEWSIYDYNTDRTWEANSNEMIERFYLETKETQESLNGKLLLDAGCGNGKLDDLLSVTNAIIIGIDLSNSVEKAYKLSSNHNAFYIQGDIAFPPFDFSCFDLIHSSGVLICTKNTELSFSILNEYVKPAGKLSVWLYHPRKGFIHNMFNFLRNYTSKLPIGFQYHLYRFTLFPVSYVIKKIKGNKQTKNEMMISIMDWFSPEYRWEIKHDVAKSWFLNRNYKEITVTTDEHFGFNIIGNKN